MKVLHELRSAFIIVQLYYSYAIPNQKIKSI